jgi:hypothetical protein
MKWLLWVIGEEIAYFWEITGFIAYLGWRRKKERVYISKCQVVVLLSCIQKAIISRRGLTLHSLLVPVCLFLHVLHRISYPGWDSRKFFSYFVYVIITYSRRGGGVPPSTTFVHLFGTVIFFNWLNTLVSKGCKMASFKKTFLAKR